MIYKTALDILPLLRSKLERKSSTKKRCSCVKEKQTCMFPCQDDYKRIVWLLLTKCCGQSDVGNASCLLEKMRGLEVCSFVIVVILKVTEKVDE